jgi:hypothetical protein
LDNILIATETIEEHHQVLDWVLTRLTVFRLKGKREKCQFYASKVEFLGYEISANGVRVPETCLIGLETMTNPNNLYQLPMFVGFFNCFRRFIYKYSHIMEVFQ